MQEIIISIMNNWGYLGIALLIAVENIFPPIPSEVILTFGGFMTTYSNLKLIGIIISSTIGSVLGAIILYIIGRIINKERLEKIVEGKIGTILHFKKQDIEKANSWFEKRGKSTVFFCRFIPIVRSLISIPAGITKMKFFSFVLLTTVGSIIWNSVLAYLGVIAGASWETVVAYIDSYSKIVLIFMVILLLIGTILFYKKRSLRIEKLKKLENVQNIEHLD